MHMTQKTGSVGSGASNDSVCVTPLPPKYMALVKILENSFPKQQAQALARVMCEIDKGAGEMRARRILMEDGGFEEERAHELAKILYGFHLKAEGHAA